MALLAELTHRCPLRCPYCSNPLDLLGRSRELATSDWQTVLDQAAAIGVLQIHFSGGEPLLRPDLPTLVAHAATLGLYTNLITSGIQLDQPALDRLVAAGIDHIQLSFQDAEPASAERIGGLPGAQAQKLGAARLIAQSGLPLTLNFVVHRQNLARLPDMLALATHLGAARVEIAHTQYYGWGLLNRNALLPDAAALDLATEQVRAARLATAGRMLIDYVTPDYHATRPKPCMGGWARRFLIVSPDGTALPCHAATTLPGMDFPSVRHHSLGDIWHHHPAFTRFRGTAWLPQACQSCAHIEEDFGGCRCQALALAGDAAAIDPVCQWSPDHQIVQAAIATAAASPPIFTYRGARLPAPSPTT